MLALSRQQFITTSVPKEIMLQVIRNIKQQVQQGNITGEQALDALEQFVKEYQEDNKVVSIFSKPKNRQKLG